MKIREFLKSDIKNLKAFCDANIGKDYYTDMELTDCQKRSEKNGIVTSFVLVADDNETDIQGLRLCYPPGQWDHGKGKRLSPDLWGHGLTDLAIGGETHDT